MNTTILAISPQAPSLAFATWLGGAGLSVCGVFVVQYFSIKAFSVTDEDVGLVLNEDGGYANLAVLAGIIAGPVVMKLWSAVLFLIGTIDYIVETEALSSVYKMLTGTAIVLLAMVVGERIDRKLYKKLSSPPGHKESCPTPCTLPLWKNPGSSLLGQGGTYFSAALILRNALRLLLNS
ncbi:hypothetical protein FA13DRAFT_1745453 [Coprinellus micaceus]|uniref:Uncharacterized protein n=1 Tax=Coprinellus micaceus TaxID=71717 RepID=A0A4Y7SB97_COPMI|nr:hypothetical protein FA13DRAFT_1745453 [Coprinellus micaceus]